jgi:hypothetical protein
MIQNYFKQYTSAATLAFYRLAFGFSMLLSLIRFASYGWIESFISPQNSIFQYGFEWVKPIGNYTYVVFLICGIAALFVAIGYKYKWAIITFIEFYLYRANG